jgi:hypothetical protein
MPKLTDAELTELERLLDSKSFADGMSLTGKLNYRVIRGLIADAPELQSLRTALAAKVEECKELAAEKESRYGYELAELEIELLRNFARELKTILRGE